MFKIESLLLNNNFATATKLLSKYVIFGKARSKNKPNYGKS